MNCTRCHTPLPDEARFCFSCGSDLSGGGVATVVQPRDVTAELQDRLTHVLNGRYVVKKLLGAGGMGAVFLADDLTLERTVAIKVLPPDMSRDERVVARFQREAKTAAKLDHRNIIPIHRVESESGLHYFVMKYVTGRSLDSMLEGGQPLPIPFATRVLAEAAAALGHAHQRGVVHRDVKPANIMLDADDQVVLTDFGISKAGDLTSQLTQTGMIIGTPYYMAPEQATGREVDGRADQYSLAILGFQLFTGRLPFRGDSAHTIIYRHVSEEAPLVSSLRTDVSPAVDAALARALRKQPEERFATMEEFSAALRGEAAAPQSASRVPATRVMNAATVRMATPQRTRRRSRWPAAIAALLVTAVVGVAAIWMVRGRIGPSSVAASPTEKALQSPEPANSAPTMAIVDTGAPPASTTDSAVATPPNEPRELPVRPLGQRSGRRQPAERPIQKATERREENEASAHRFAPLTVASEPYGTLYVNGIEVGDTPIANHRLPVGQRVELRVERDGYKTRRESIMVSGPNPIRRRYILEPGEQP
ncbi:MAG: protein kinase [Gemmatimonadota bacterium]|nr:protein kinase [Gemmatimonadota bacterium]